MTSATIALNVAELLRFFDEAVPGSAGHASAIVAIAGEDLGAALFISYLNSDRSLATVLPERCTQGTKKGHRLDRWVQTKSNVGDMLYQVEIKNWSAHAFGGRKLSISATPEEIKAYKIEAWAKEWDGTTFRKDYVRKVLTPMRAPKPLPVEPVVCYWTAMHPDGAESPFFTVPLTNQAFNCVSVFSMSSYLRGLNSTQIRLDLPNVVARREWLDRFFR